MSQANSLPQIWIIDACSALNLIATGHIEAILNVHFRGQTHQYTMAGLVVNEAAGLRRGGIKDDADERDPIDWEPHFAAGYLRREGEPTDDEFLDFVQLSTQLDAGEAMTIALAQSRGYGVVTDDRKAQRILDGSPFLDTPTLLHNWSVQVDCTPIMLQSALRQIVERACFFPRRNHMLKGWWDSNTS